MRTDVSFLSVATGASVTPVKRIPRKIREIKSLVMSLQRKDLIPNQDINMLGTKKYQILPPQLSKFRPRYKSLRNAAEDDRNYYTYTSHNYKEGSVENIKAMNNKNIDDK